MSCSKGQKTQEQLNVHAPVPSASLAILLCTCEFKFSVTQSKRCHQEVKVNDYMGNAVHLCCRTHFRSNWDMLFKDVSILLRVRLKVSYGVLARLVYF